MKPIRQAVRWLGNSYIRRVLALDYKRQQADSRGPNERPLEYSFALNALSFSQYQDVLDVGAGISAWPAILRNCGYHVTAIDKVSGYWSEELVNHHIHIIRDDIVSPKIDKEFGIITCLSTLEHIPSHLRAVTSMANLMRPGGILVLSFPYNEHRYVENVYDLPEAGYGKDQDYICQVFSRDVINKWLSTTALRLVQQRYYRFFTGELWTLGHRLWPGQEVDSTEPHHLTGIVLQKIP